MRKITFQRIDYMILNWDFNDVRDFCCIILCNRQTSSTLRHTFHLHALQDTALSEQGIILPDAEQ